jgi:carbamoyltransferase
MGQLVLALTLGHNSSAVAIRDNEVLGGYEEERLTMEKSDSRFPVRSIEKLKALYGDFDAVCVSHWFPNGELSMRLVNKYWDPVTLAKLAPNCEVYNASDGNTSHHDCHAASAAVFAGKDFPNESIVLVADGFGTLGEHLSIYKKSGFETKLVTRLYGFNLSLGLFYQYATKFCGMKMHQHEYKMLAYETHLDDIVAPSAKQKIDDYVDSYSQAYVGYINNGKQEQNLLSLPETDRDVDRTLRNYLSLYSGYTVTSRIKILVSYFAQRHLENVIAYVLRKIRPVNLIVAGGIFYNVKLNHILCEMVPGKFCAMPLAGDQGAGLGAYEIAFGRLKWPEHLFWGHREIDGKVGATTGITVTANWPGKVSEALGSRGIVNLVRGSMEFGPRALCNTSTLALPTKINAEVINRMNDRTNEMPFALVMTEQQAKESLDGVDRVHKSLEYMIMARRVKPTKVRNFESGIHYYPASDTYTCRPQITKDPILCALLRQYGPLINTSWNYHGVPIVYDTESLLHTHGMETQRMNEIGLTGITTVVDEEVCR